jgi:hypothetical protein
MNKEQQELLGEAYENYCKSFENQTLIEQYSFDTDPMIQLMFLNKCKTNPEFSEKWGLKIEERELNDDELNIANLFKQTSNKLITITYNDKTIESYE